MENYLVAFDLPPAACVAAITGAIPRYLTSSADQMSTRGRPGFECGFRHDILMFVQMSGSAHSVDSVGVDSYAVRMMGRCRRHNAVYTSVDFNLLS